MRYIDPGPDFQSWRDVARPLLLGGVHPSDVFFGKETGLFGESVVQEKPAPYGQPAKVPGEFFELAKDTSCHIDPERWNLLYRILWRITKQGERDLCKIASDPDISKASRMAKNVRREIHKMHAFVRFRLVSTDPETNKETFAAWFEPDHHIVRTGAPFFRKRFANMDWSILTPRGCAHWNGKELTFTKGIPKDPLEDADDFESAWKTYYRSIFNPARVKVGAMKSEMPEKYWKNLPEAELIKGLIDDSRSRVSTMEKTELRPAKPAPKNEYLSTLRDLSATPACAGPTPGMDLTALATAAQSCQGCPLWKNATGTVFGSGPKNARVMIVGEQPGDKEDIAGTPFVGPAGKLLHSALEEAGLDPSEIYFTNAVKHFKWTPKDTPRGKIRLHQSPDKSEIEACRPWVLAELNQIAPDVLILLGSSAGKSLLGRSLPVTKNRGLIDAPHLAPTVILTVHPSYLLRIPDRGGKEEEFSRFVEDLRSALGSKNHSTQMPPASS